MFVQIQETPNPNSLKFIPGKKVSNSGPYEITKKDNIKNNLINSKVFQLKEQFDKAQEDIKLRFEGFLNNLIGE